MRGPRSLAAIVALAALSAALPRAGSAQLTSTPPGPEQTSAGAATAPVAAGPVAGPSQDNATAGIRSHVSEENLTREQAAAAASGHSLTKPAILMIVGGAAFVAGLIIGGTGGTILAVAGALVAIYGLYLFLQ
jgi:hypothetical protein